MAKANKKFRVTFPDGSYEVHEAAKMQQDGSGCRLFDAAGDMVASWADGQYRSCAPDVKRVAAPSAPAA